MKTTDTPSVWRPDGTLDFDALRRQWERLWHRWAHTWAKSVGKLSPDAYDEFFALVLLGVARAIRDFKPERSVHGRDPLGRGLMVYASHWARSYCRVHQRKVLYGWMTDVPPDLRLGTSVFTNTDCEDGAADGLAETVADGRLPATPGRQARLTNHERAASVAAALLPAVTDGRVRKMVEQRYLEGMTLTAVGREWGVTKEWARQLIGRGLDQMRAAAAEGGW